MESSDLPVPASQTGLAAPPVVAVDLKIADDVQYQGLALLLQNVKHNLKMVDELEESEKRDHLDALTRIRAYYKPLREGYATAEQRLKAAITAYSDRKDAERIEAQRKLNEAAEREREKLLKRADKIKNPERATQLREQAEATVAPVIDDAAPKVDGLHFTDKWDFEITNPAIVPIEYRSIDEAKIRKVVSALKDSTNIAGVRVFKRRIPASGAKSQ